MRFTAHILNLTVQERVKDASISVDLVRGAMRYIRASPSRLSKFNRRTEEKMVGTKAHLCLDVPTRWNSTYMMLNVAEEYEYVFEAYVHNDHSFSLDLSTGYGVPTCDDWENVRRVTKVLEPFYELTLKVSGSFKSELDRYLGEDCENNSGSFDLLLWWKVNSPRFPIVARMAQDVLSIPISTIAFEIAFNTSGCVLDDFRSSLTPSMVEALVCTQDWL
ncbi:hypothetical protein CXB51_027233 [Gossypium anomalum]|uniref:HAT C-terminal dimerisation domain-containing protein n=1 Tax=Gossypium anomalum TaxID=47600 RepID=A0A8J5YN07_9ROSI|nr:hypothetical protein CXB51_027233 [Gossypium anomalum]